MKRVNTISPERLHEREWATWPESHPGSDDLGLDGDFFPRSQNADSSRGQRNLVQ